MKGYNTMKVTLNAHFSTPYEDIKIIRYAKDGNTVITKKVNAQNIGGNFYATAAESSEYCNYKTREIFVFYPSIALGLYLDRIDEERTVTLPDSVSTPENLIAYMDDLATHEAHIQLTFVEIAKRIAPERIPDYMRSREIHRQRQQERTAKLEAERQEAYRQEIERTNAAAEKQEHDSIRIFRQGGEIENSTISFARMGEDGYPKESSTCILLHLLRKYGISVPLKTQGWINNSLYRVYIRDGRIASISRNRRSSISQTAIECLSTLCQIINESEE